MSEVLKIRPCLAGAADLNSSLVAPTALRQIPARVCLVDEGEPVEGPNDTPFARIHDSLRVICLACTEDEAIMFCE